MRHSFGEELRRIRTAAGTSLAALAEAMGWSIVYISDIERSRRNPPCSADVEKMLQALNADGEVLPMLRLAAEAREMIEVSVERQGDQEVNDMLVTLARTADRGGITREKARKIRSSRKGCYWLLVARR